jgi:hypothetical protein
LPSELLLSILEILFDLHSRSSTQKCRLAVLNVALTCRRFYELARHIAGVEVLFQLKTWSDLKLPKRTPLVALARRVAWMCSFCHNRARYPTFSKRELFTDWLVCQACDSFYFPKISDERLKILYDIGENALESVPFVHHRGVRIYPWEHVARLRKENRITLKSDVVIYGYYGEEFQIPRWCYLEHSGFFGENSLANSYLTTWNISEHRMLREILLRWTGKEEIPDSPSTLDSILFHEFWYRFNPTSSIPDTPRGMQWRWGHIAKLWATSQNWHARPWSMSNFPFPRPSYLTTPDWFEKLWWLKWKLPFDDFEKYQRESGFYHRLFQIYPEILGYPDDWIKCKISFDEWAFLDEYLVQRLRKEWKPGARGKVDEWYEFELFKEPNRFDVILITDIPTTRPLKTDPLERTYPRCEWVVVQNGSVKVKDPNIWRNTKPTEKGLKLVLQSEGSSKVYSLKSL